MIWSSEFELWNQRGPSRELLLFKKLLEAWVQLSGYDLIKLLHGPWYWLVKKRLQLSSVSLLSSIIFKLAMSDNTKKFPFLTLLTNRSSSLIFSSSFNWLQAVAAGSLINLATILHINSIRVILCSLIGKNYYSFFSLSSLLCPKYSENFFTITGPRNYGIFFLCIFWLASPHWPVEG